MTNLTFSTQDLDEQAVHERYILFVDYTEELLDAGDQLVEFVTGALTDELGDEVTVTSVKVKRPRIVSRSFYRVFRKMPQAKIQVVTAF